MGVPGAVLAHRPRLALHSPVKGFRGGLVFEAHRLFTSLSPRLESKQDEEEVI